MRGWFSEPLLHFLLAGGLLFAAYAWLNRGEDEEPREVRITAAEVAWLKETWARQWQRSPNEQELRGLVTDYLKETLLAREAAEMGLERTTPSSVVGWRRRWSFWWADFPAVVLFHEVTERYPNKANWDDVTKMLCDIERRLRHFPTAEELLPFYKAWTGCGWNPNSINWFLSYAIRGQLPQNNFGKAVTPHAKPQVSTPSEYCQSDRELAARIRAQRANV